MEEPDLARRRAHPCATIPATAESEQLKSPSILSAYDPIIAASARKSSYEASAP